MNTRLIFVLFLISFVLVACQLQEPLPEATQTAVVSTETLAPSDTPTEIPATATHTPTLTSTSTPTKPPIPPTPTVAPPMVLLDYLDNVSVTQTDYFESSMGWDLWTGKISNGVLEIIGKDWNGLAKRRKISEGEGIIIDFKYEKNSEFELMFDYGEWWTDPYRRFGIYIWGSYPKANLWLGKNGLGFNNLHGNFQPKADTWYTLLMAVDSDGEFLSLIWDPTDPTQIFSYHEKAGEKWAGYSWVFKLGANAGTITFDNFMKITFDEMKQ
ncbi:MAG: hypothetical protein U9Q82_08055 [Chloroflexota bacterium]|nr:hypothetical protein [Chloroflexota bacterium]